MKAPTQQGTTTAADKRKSATICALCGIVFILSAVLVIIGIAIESSAHNGLGYTLGLLSLIPLGLSAWGLAKHYPAWKNAIVNTPPRPFCTSANGHARHSDTLMGAAAEAHDEHRFADEDDQESDWQASADSEPVARDQKQAQRERHLTPKGEEPFIGGLDQMRQAAEAEPEQDTELALEPDTTFATEPDRDASEADAGTRPASEPSEEENDDIHASKPRVRVTSGGRIIGLDE